MNYLAHSLLSCHDPYLLTGNFVTDMMTKAEIARLPADIQAGAVLHRYIDTFTDGHQSIKASVSLLRPTQGKYSPVAVDILYDYFLSVNWARYSDETLEQFTTKVYTMLIEHSDLLPDRFRPVIKRMVDGDFLMSCSNVDRLMWTFARVKNKASFSNNFERAHLDMLDHRIALDKHFNLFFPDLIEQVQTFCKCNIQDNNS